MVAKNDCYRAPRPVLIDFGLSTKFSAVELPRSEDEEGVGSPSGTPGYVPPETWETEVWYPLGDIFSMGVVFFQLMVARVPGADSRVEGVLQCGSEASDFARDARERPFPWDLFPRDMDLLKHLIEAMTQCDRHLRPRATQALKHRWFQSKGDAKLPQATIRDLVSAAEGHTAKEQVMEQLQIMNNLDELRSLKESYSELTTPRSKGAVVAQSLRLLQEYGVQTDVAKTLVNACTGGDGRCQLATIIDETLEAKASYGHQIIHDLFDELDTDLSGELSAAELRVLLDSVAFECPYSDIDELMAKIDADQDGMVSFREFKTALLEDGRIARRSDVDAQRQQACSLM